MKRRYQATQTRDFLTGAVTLSFMAAKFYIRQRSVPYSPAFHALSRPGRAYFTSANNTKYYCSTPVPRDTNTIISRLDRNFIQFCSSEQF